jgi:dihydropteroate synthase
MTPRAEFNLEISGRKVRLGQRTLLMGVLNVTPDSFSDGGLFLAPDRAIERGLELARQGADWIDVGGESTRPGSKPITAEEELARVLPVIEGLRRALDRAGGLSTREAAASRRSRESVEISIDTTKASVAEAAARAGASIINDVSGLRFDPGIAEVARRHRTPLVLMHLRGRPETMQQKPFAKSVWRSVGDGLEWSVRQALQRGVRRSQLIIDPGLGFGKTRRQNFQILAQLDRLRRFRLPILVGTSRKSFVQAIVAGEGLDPSRQGVLLTPAQDRRTAGVRLKSRPAPGPWVLTDQTESLGERPTPLLIGDAAAVVASILAGAHLVRVHDVATALPGVRFADAVLTAVGGR